VPQVFAELSRKGGYWRTLGYGYQKKNMGLVGINQHLADAVKQRQVYDKVKNKIYFITNAVATMPEGEECLSLYDECERVMYS